jgi:hypothetical protein
MALLFNLKQKDFAIDCTRVHKKKIWRYFTGGLAVLIFFVSTTIIPPIRTLNLNTLQLLISVIVFCFPVFFQSTVFCLYGEFIYHTKDSKFTMFHILLASLLYFVALFAYKEIIG